MKQAEPREDNLIDGALRHAIASAQQGTGTSVDHFSDGYRVSINGLSLTELMRVLARLEGWQL